MRRRSILAELRSHQGIVRCATVYSPYFPDRAIDRAVPHFLSTQGKSVCTAGFLRFYIVRRTERFESVLSVENAFVWGAIICWHKHRKVGLQNSVRSQLLTTCGCRKKQGFVVYYGVKCFACLPYSNVINWIPIFGSPFSCLLQIVFLAYTKSDVLRFFLFTRNLVHICTSTYYVLLFSFQKREIKGSFSQTFMSFSLLIFTSFPVH